MLPNFMCIGASKSGTTSLYDILKQHSQIFIPYSKEPHFFDMPKVYSNGLEWYRKTYYSKVNNEKCIGDFSPTYLFDADAAKRIKNDLGENLKFIVILRNPVDRAYSHFLHSRRDQHESLSFNEALIAEKERLDSDDYLSILRFSYIEQGFYYKMLKRYYNLFPKENFLIINFEKEFIKERKDTVLKIFNFLELDSEKINIDLKSNQASRAKFIFLKKIMKKTGWWRKIIKFMIPSLNIRQIIKNKIHQINLIRDSRSNLDNVQKDLIYKRFFEEDICKLENLINKKMNWHK